MKLTLKNKIKLVERVLGTCTSKNLSYIKKEIVKLTDEEFYQELDKLKKEMQQ